MYLIASSYADVVKKETVHLKIYLCTVLENGHFVLGSGKENLFIILKQTRSHTFQNKMF